MYKQVDFTELKEIQKQILKGISPKDSTTEIKTLAAFSLTSKEKKMLCVCVVFDANTLQILEEKESISDELLPYSPNFVAFREGPAIVLLLKELEHKPDVILLEGFGSLIPHKVGTANYVGVLTNKPCVAVADSLIFGRLEEEKIMVNNDQKGVALKTKEFANPVYLTLGHNLSLDTAQNLVKKWINTEYKMPYPLYIAHKNLVKLKKSLGKTENVSLNKESIGQEA